MTIQMSDTADLLDILDQATAQLRSGNNLDELQGLSAARMVLTEIRQRVADTGNIAGNPDGDIHGYPERSREQRITDRLMALGANREIPERLRSHVAATIDAEEHDTAKQRMTDSDRALLERHTVIADELARPSESQFRLATARNKQNHRRATDDIDTIWGDLLDGPAIDIIAVCIGTDSRSIQLRRRSPFI